MTKKFARLGLVSGALVLAAAAPAFATIAYPGGGTWDYGTNSSIVWSDYYHGSLCHGSTSVGSYTDRSPNTSAGYWSITDAPSRPLVVDYSYWRHC